MESQLYQVVCSTKSYLPHNCLLLVKVHTLCYVYPDILTFKHWPAAIGAGVPGHINTNTLLLDALTTSPLQPLMPFTYNT